MESHAVKILLVSALAAPLALGTPAATAAGIELLAFDSQALPAGVPIGGRSSPAPAGGIGWARTG